MFFQFGLLGFGAHILFELASYLFILKGPYIICFSF